MTSIRGKTALITGSSRGIGAAIAVAFAEAGAHVVINYLNNKSAAEATLTSVQEHGGKGIIQQADVRDQADIIKLMDRTVKEFGGIDILVNNAHSPFEISKVEDLSWEQVLEQLEGTLGGAFRCIKSALPYLKLSSCGNILNISSVTTHKPEIGFAHRNLAKSALESLTLTLALELAHQSVRVNALSVGWTETDQLQNLSKEYRDHKISGIPMKRPASPVEIANTALFLVSPLSSYVTGIVFCVAGGL